MKRQNVLICFAMLYLLSSTPVNTAQSDKPTFSLPTYSPKAFNDVRGLSRDQITEHKTLYENYVKKRNQITQNLATVSRQDAASTTYSPFRELKIEETYAYNGSILHELYFENLSGRQGAPGKNTTNLLVKSFGSIDAWKSDFIDCAGCARGWVLVAYSLDDNLVHNFVLESHNDKVPVLTIPLIVFDAYEHAYFTDFGIDRQSYITRFLQTLNWSVVEARTGKWLRMT